MVVYVENGGDFTVPLDAVKAVHAQKVIVDPARLHPVLRRPSATPTTPRIPTSDRLPLPALQRGEREGRYAWLAAMRSKSPRSTASSFPVRQPPFMSRTSGEGPRR